MNEQITKNCHYISRFLTRPWEDEQRRLRYYDFDTSKFEQKTSRFLFAADRLNSQVVEDWLNTYVERPLSKARPGLSRGQGGALDEWPFFRAATLMLWLQGTRSSSVGEPEQRLDLERLADFPEGTIDALVVAFREDYDLATVVTTTVGGRLAPLLVPSTGIFPFIIDDPSCLTGKGIGIALPLDLHCALVALPNGAMGAADEKRLPASISNYSIGTTEARRVVVPPGAVAAAGSDDLEQTLIQLRADGTHLMTAVSDKRAMIIQAFAAVGLQPEWGSAGRLLSPDQDTDEHGADEHGE